VYTKQDIDQHLVVTDNHTGFLDSICCFSMRLSTKTRRERQSNKEAKTKKSNIEHQQSRFMNPVYVIIEN
jgi:ribosome biogenesis GTPase A